MRRFFILCFACCSLSVGAEKLVSAGGSLTEIIFALGADDQLVGVDSSSVYPLAAQELPNVGYYRALNVEGLLSVEPQRLLLLNGAGPQAVLNQAESLGLDITVINNPKSIEGLYITIEEVANATHKVDQGEQLISQIRGALQSIDELSSVAGKSAVFLMSAGERGLVAAGENTTPQLIFDQLALVNPFSSLEGFKSVSAEVLANAKPDIILLASHTTGDTSVEDLCADPQLAIWASKNGCQLHKVDSLQFLGLTPRLPAAIEHTHNLLVNHAN